MPLSLLMINARLRLANQIFPLLLLQECTEYSYNTNCNDLLNCSCDPCISLIKSNFESLYFKENKIEVLKNSIEDETKEIFNNTDLDNDITDNELASDIKKYPKLEALYSTT